MVIKKTKMNKTDSKQNVSQSITSSSGVISSSAMGSTVTGGGQAVISTQQTPVIQKSTSSSMVTKSSSSTKVSSSSTQEQKFFSSSSSSSKATKTQQLQSQSDSFLRGERMVTDIDSKRSKNGSIVIESVDLHNVSGDFSSKSNLDNLLSIEIESKGARAAASEFVTNTSSGVGNRNDAITVESERKSGETTSTAVSALNRDAHESSSSFQQASSSATSSSTYQEFSSSSKGNDSKEVKSTASKNLASSTTMKNGQIVDNKNVADTTTTFTSKVYDDKTKSWVVVQQSSVNETDIVLPAATTSSTDVASSNKMNTMTISSAASGIDSTNKLYDSSMRVDSSNSKLMKSDVQSSSKSSKEILEKNMSSKKESSRDEKIVSTSTSETVQVFDSKTKTWKTVDSSTLDKQKRPSYVRYRSQSDDGSWHTIYKRKLYDEFSRQWRIVDEKVVSGDGTSRFDDIPEMIENSANMTTTTYTTKVYDTKTGKWTIVDEKSYVDKESANVTQDIKREIEKDQPDLANIITTTETTKVRKPNAIKF